MECEHVVDIATPPTDPDGADWHIETLAGVSAFQH
jgi:hypothetical protein